MSERAKHFCASHVPQPHHRLCLGPQPKVPASSSIGIVTGFGGRILGSSASISASSWWYTVRESLSKSMQAPLPSFTGGHTFMPGWFGSPV